MRLIFGLAFIAVSIWLLNKNRKQTGWLSALLRIDTLVLLIAGSYLTINAVLHTFLA
ncbi:MAG: hypothetical protein JSS79_20835 [Bacteroidetes bacterium]|nr:hypothetical protein [Bacteroidota bacterium]